ncbi:MAG TPA: hypothetical protein VN647_08865 [Nitrospira sp.]|nr:hypothetical protein [Nitrospira sp.]
MSVRTIKRSTIPNPIRGSGGLKSALHSLPEWSKIEKVIEKGLTPAEAVEITIDAPPSVLRLKNPIGSLVHLLRKEVKKSKEPLLVSVRKDPTAPGPYKARVYLVTVANPV